MSTRGGPWGRREPGPAPDDLPQPDGSCDVCEPDEAKPSTQVCPACSFAFCPTHAEEHSRRTRHRLTPYHQETTPPRSDAPDANAAAAAAATAQEVGVNGLVLNEEEEEEKKKVEEVEEEEGAAAASQPRDTSKQAEIFGILAAAVEMVMGGAKAPEEVPGEDGAAAAAPGDQPAEGGDAPSQPGEAAGAPEAAQQGAEQGAEQDDDSWKESVSVERLRCLVHGQDGTLYCRTDQKVVCVVCALQGEHRGHEIITLYEAYVWQKSRPGPDILAETKLMGERIMSKWADPVLNTDELQTYVDAQFEELKRLMHVQEARNRHLVDLKEAFVTAAAAEQIAEITVETERLQEEMSSISQELSALNRAKMRADLAAAAAPGAVIPDGLRERLGQPDGRPHDAEARLRLLEAHREPRRDPAARRDRDDDGPRSSQGNAP